MDELDRYAKWYKAGGTKEFYLADYTPDIQECKFLLLKVIEQTINDYCSLEGSDIPNAHQLWEEARDFLFDDDYWICWGEMEMGLSDILDILDIDPDWVRSQAKKKYRKRNDKRNKQRQGN